MAPEVSIVIVNYNGREWLEKCLDSIEAQSYGSLEIVFVDNGSSDGSAEFVRERYPRVCVIESPGNLGFTGGSNLGLQSATGKYILFLNTDTWMEKDCLENLLKAFEEIPHLGAAQPKLKLMGDPTKIQLCGHFWTDSSCLYLYGYGKEESLPVYNRPFPVFAGAGAALLVSKEALDRVGAFDESFWCYYEDVDLCSRLWLAGYECWYYPAATVHHALGATVNTFNRGAVRYHHVKNWLTYMLKNFELRTLCAAVPMFFLSNLLSLVFRLFQGEVEFIMPFLRALLYNIQNRRDILERRRTIQSLRVVGDAEVFRKVKRNPRLSYYYYLNRGPEKYRD